MATDYEMREPSYAHTLAGIYSTSGIVDACCLGSYATPHEFPRRVHVESIRQEKSTPREESIAPSPAIVICFEGFDPPQA